MDSIIITTLISSGTAAVVTVVSQWIGSRKTRRQLADIERLKFDLEQEKIDREEDRKVWRASHESIDLAL